jgi:serine/threonine-protein kinase TTK/MPS1
VSHPQLMLVSLADLQVNGVYYDRVGLLGKGGTSKVYSIMCPVKRTILALKRVTLDRADHETYQSYTNEIELLKRLRGHDRIIQLVDHQITFSPNNRPKVLLMVCPLVQVALEANNAERFRSWNVARLTFQCY